MVVRQSPLFATGSTQLDVAGAGEVTLTPPGGYSWDVTGASVEVSSPSPQPAAQILRDGHYFENTYAGHLDASGSAYTVQPGSTLTCSWTGGAPGARATFRVWGAQTSP